MDEASTDGAKTAAPAENVPDGPLSEADALRELVIAAISTVYDPEIPVNIYELGLIYDIGVNPDRTVEVVMTLTSPMCPVAESLPGEVEMRIRDVQGVNDVDLDLVWDPPWDPEMMSEAAKLELNF